MDAARACKPLVKVDIPDTAVHLERRVALGYQDSVCCSAELSDVDERDARARKHTARSVRVVPALMPRQ